MRCSKCNSTFSNSTPVIWRWNAFAVCLSSRNLSLKHLNITDYRKWQPSEGMACGNRKWYCAVYCRCVRLMCFLGSHHGSPFPFALCPSDPSIPSHPSNVRATLNLTAGGNSRHNKRKQLHCFAMCTSHISSQWNIRHGMHHHWWMCEALVNNETVNFLLCHLKII